MDHDTIEFIRKHKAIAIIRKIYGDDLVRLGKALSDGGVRLMEVTFDQADPGCLTKTGESIRTLCRLYGDNMLIGAGTVMNTMQVETAKNAGAKYIISPNVSEEVITYTKNLGLVSIPGAMTPTEIAAAHDYGADFVKLFPIGDLPPGYIKSIKGPLGHIEYLATGGVSAKNFGGYLDSGFSGAGIGSYLSDRKLIAEGNFDELTRRAGEFSDIAEGKK